MLTHVMDTPDIYALTSRKSCNCSFVQSETRMFHSVVQLQTTYIHTYIHGLKDRPFCGPFTHLAFMKQRYN